LPGIQRQITQKARQTVTLHGMVGVGKSMLAAAFALARKL
jgi:hypothetical protein